MLPLTPVWHTYYSVRVYVCLFACACADVGVSEKVDWFDVPFFLLVCKCNCVRVCVCICIVSTQFHNHRFESSSLRSGYDNGILSYFSPPLRMFLAHATPSGNIFHCSIVLSKGLNFLTSFFNLFLNNFLPCPPED